MSTHSEGPEQPGASGLPDADGPVRSGADLRGAPRFALLLRVAKLVIDGREQFCVIRDASATGLKVRLFAPLAEQTQLAVELANGDRHHAHCVWVADDHAGLAFNEPIALDRLINEAKDVGRRRHVRLRIALDGVLHSGGEAIPVSIHNISQQGAAIDSEKWLLLHELVKIETAVLPPLYAKVRWRDHPRYGVIFEQIFQLEELARHCSGLPAPIAPAQHDSTDPRAASGS
ncbi:PilZ domain-containing protein [Novosphingobium sp.]|uniref:PilZ domain-containing protein n=1 Tax=Novosphingobium sp. TaxID=1874826 RepID=UPI00333EA466